MNVTTNQTTIESDAEVPLIRITREFDAPPSRVFQAHTDPELVLQWLGPRHLTMQIHKWDCRTGGEYRYIHTSGDDEYGFHGCFHEVRPNELIVQTFTFEGIPDGVSLERITLLELDDNRTQLVSTSLLDSFEARDALVASGMESGVTEGYERLDELLAS